MTLPLYPCILGSCERITQDRVTISDFGNGRIIEIEEEPGGIAALYQALEACDGSNSIDLVKADCNGYLDKVLPVLKELLEIGILVDSRTVPYKVLEECRRGRPIPYGIVEAIDKKSRWRPKQNIHPVLTRSTIEPPKRGSSLSLDTPQNSVFNRVSLLKLTEIMADGYGTYEGESKPVASAGKLWPLTFHLWSVSDETTRQGHLYWFDDDCGTLFNMGYTMSTYEIGSWFVQSNYTTNHLERVA